MFVKLEDEVIKLLCCPFCKSDLQISKDSFSCDSCGLEFPAHWIESGSGKREKVFDFRLHWPSYCVPQGLNLWQDTQLEYEIAHDGLKDRDSLQLYLDEIDSVKEIYTQEFQIEGKVLDIGGGQGRLRHFLPDDIFFVSIDPYINVFAGLEDRENLIKAFPSLIEPCNFLSAYGEYLPFKSESFDWIHMRSVVDHFADPYRAFLEAYRCCKPGGKLLVGLAIMERYHAQQTLFERSKRKIERDGYRGFVHGSWRKISRASSHKLDDHMYRFTYKELIDLFRQTGWRVDKEHWQKPPFDYCLYASGEARAKES